MQTLCCICLLPIFMALLKFQKLIYEANFYRSDDSQNGIKIELVIIEFWNCDVFLKTLNIIYRKFHN